MTAFSNSFTKCLLGLELTQPAVNSNISKIDLLVQPFADAIYFQTRIQMECADEWAAKGLI